MTLQALFDARRLAAAPVVLVALVAATLCPAHAADATTPQAALAVMNESPSPTAARQDRPFGARPLPGFLLATQRGGDAAVLGAQLQGSVSGNSVSQATTGSNTIAAGSFAGSSGIATVIQNTGNNVLIQNAVVVNLTLR